MDLTLPLSYKELKGFFTQLIVIQARLMPMFLLLPLFARAMVPRTITFAIAAGLGLLVVPLLPPASEIPAGLPLMTLLLKEAFIGVVLGFVAAIPFWLFDVMGFVIDNQRGASMAATVNPMTGHDSSPLGMLFSFAFITFFMVAGGFQMLLSMIYDSYRLWAPLSYWPAFTPEAAKLLMVQLNRLMATGLLLAAPVLVAMFLSEVGLALVSRFAPQLQVFFLAMPIKSGIAIFVLIVYMSTIFDFAHEPMREIADWAVRLDGVMGVGSGAR
jgi:type III secretion protein T